MMETEYDSTEIEYDFSQGKRGAIDSVGAGKIKCVLPFGLMMMCWNGFGSRFIKQGEEPIKLCSMRHCDHICSSNMSR
jgi:hypothetical protein